MAAIDWVVIAIYVVLAFAVSLALSKKAARGATDFFVAGRSLGWFVAGTSMVATTFAADTPLFISGLARSEGIYANWFWWSAAPAALATIFFFAPLWRRSEVLTEIEFLSIRYQEGRPTKSLRIGKAIYDGLFTNIVILAAVTVAISKVITVTTGLTTEPVISIFGVFSVSPVFLILMALGLITVVYTVLSGLYGVVYTDLIQFCLAMIGSVALAVIAYADFQGLGGIEALRANPGFEDKILNFVPNFENFDLEVLTFIILISFSWLGMASGSGYFIQRILATKTEKDAVLAFSWYAFTNYILRSWPWIIIGVVSLIYFPALIDAEQSYPLMIDRFLPPGLKGIMIASLLAAFMSTLDTHLNWGASYLVNDVYRPYIKKEKSEAHYITAARICMVIIMFLAIAAASQLTSIIAIHKFFGLMTIGIAFVSIARWYWWRVTIWTEITALLTSTIVGLILYFAIPDQPGQDYFAVRLFINMTITTLVSILVTLRTSPKEPTEKTKAFYKKIRPAGPGWRAVSDATGVTSSDQRIGSGLIGWAASLTLLYGMLFATGSAIFEDWESFAWLSAIAIVGGFIAYKSLLTLLKQLTAMLATDNSTTSDIRNET